MIHCHSFEEGKNYLFFTMTYYYIGTLVEVTETDFLLENVSVIPDTGRLNEFLAGAAPSECEPAPEGMKFIVSRTPFVSACEWPHPLPRKVI